MINAEVKEEYLQALKKGQKEVKERTALGLDPHPAVLDDILPSTDTVVEVGLVDIPAQRIVGTKTAGRITAFSPSFLPLLGMETEFSLKWRSLCADHLGESGIRDPIQCFEYYGNFYVQEGNKRVSVLRYFGAAKIPGIVKRVLPANDGSQRYQAYQEFLEFYKGSKLYAIQFRRPGDYAKLLKALGKKFAEPWTDDERKTFNAYFYYYAEAFDAIREKVGDVLPEEALLLWLQLYPYENLGKLSSTELKKTVESLSYDVFSSSLDAVKVETKQEEPVKGSILTRLMTPNHVHVAFVHQLDPTVSAWVVGHEDGRKYIEEIFEDQITVRSYYDANTPELAEEKLEQAVAEGAQVVFTTAPMLSRATLKCAVKYPKVKFFNCSVSQPYSSIRTYYGRMYEAKFITGAIAGAMAQDNRIGYIASYPIFGVPASINAFALGAQMTNPRAQIELRWSCCEGNPQADFFREDIRVVSNREVPTKDKQYMDFCNYGTYLLDDRGGMLSLGSPLWMWGKFYEKVVEALLLGAKQEKNPYNAVNYWLGMDSGIIDIHLSDKLPAGVRALADLLLKSLRAGTLDPFARKIVAQDGSLKNDGTQVFTPKELLHMDWLCENVVGEIPSFDQILPMSQNTVRELGLYRDQIKETKEGAGREDFMHLR
jgi:basic membrane lipoprotein Med (substrate-binding protein (PBP1-ABC) superfamily)